MKWMINGEEWEDEGGTDVQVEDHGDRFLVRDKNGTHSALVVKRGDVTTISYNGHIYEVSKKTRGRGGAGGGAAGGESRAPMPGQIVDILVAEGDAVSSGQKLVVLEAMKMQQGLTSGIDGVVKEVKVAVGDQVADGQLLVLVADAAE